MILGTPVFIENADKHWGFLCFKISSHSVIFRVVLHIFLKMQHEMQHGFEPATSGT